MSGHHWLKSVLTPKRVLILAVLMAGGMWLASPSAADTGTVKWWNDSKGIGAIAPDGGGEDLFVNLHDIEAWAYKSLIAGLRVQYDVARRPRGNEAVHVSPER